MQPKRQRKQATVRQPAWQEWVSRGGSDPANQGAETTHETIAALAYSYWEARGRQGGSAEEDWLRAEENMQAAGH